MTYFEGTGDKVSLMSAEQIKSYVEEVDMNAFVTDPVLYFKEQLPHILKEEEGETLADRIHDIASIVATWLSRCEELEIITNDQDLKLMSHSFQFEKEFDQGLFNLAKRLGFSKETVLRHIWESYPSDPESMSERINYVEELFLGTEKL